MGHTVMEGNGVDSIGTCHTAVITGFASHPLKHWSIPITDKTKPRETIASQRSFVNTLPDVPTKDIPCYVEVVEKVFNSSGKVLSSLSEKNSIHSNLSFIKCKDIATIKEWSVFNLMPCLPSFPKIFSFLCQVCLPLPVGEIVFV